MGATPLGYLGVPFLEQNCTKDEHKCHSMPVNYAVGSRLICVCDSHEICNKRTGAFRNARDIAERKEMLYDPGSCFVQRM